MYQCTSHEFMIL